MIEGHAGYVRIKIDKVQPHERFRWYGQWYKWSQLNDGTPVAHMLTPNEQHGDPYSTVHSIVPGTDVEMVWSPEIEARTRAA